MNTTLSRWSPRILSIMRVVIAFLFLQHGLQKLFGIPAAEQAGQASMIPLLSLMGLAGVLEFFGGLFILLGLLTRPVAFILCGEMAVAYFMAHAPQGFWPILNGGELAVLYCFLFLYLAAAGGGTWSIDHLIQSGKAAPQYTRSRESRVAEVEHY